jgi:hypothetical protein
MFPSKTTKTTLWRVLAGADATAVDAAVGAWLSAQATARQTTIDHLIQGEQRSEQGGHEGFQVGAGR